MKGFAISISVFIVLGMGLLSEKEYINIPSVKQFMVLHHC